MFAIVAAIYLFPSIVAWIRGHKNETPIAILNLAFGWTVIGWVGCLAWACSHLKPEDRKVRRL
jgi:hypothetical protein